MSKSSSCCILKHLVSQASYDIADDHFFLANTWMP
jgi:hypothetical protein